MTGCDVLDFGKPARQNSKRLPCERLMAENAKLRKKADMLQWNSDCFIKIYGSWKRLRATVPHLEAENAKLRELMYERAHVYAIQHMTEDELRITATNVMEDNAKLRELLSSYWKAVHSPATPNVPRDYLAEMRELGVEVD